MGRVMNAVRALTGQQDRALSFSQIVGDRSRIGRASSRYVSAEQALKNSVWWAGLTLRANLMSTFPLDVVRSREGLMVPVTSPGPLVSTPYPGIGITRFLWNRSWDLDSAGNHVGIITARNAFGQPAQIEQVPLELVRAQMDGRKIKYWVVDGKRYELSEIWHETQYTMSGVALGLSPLAYAARSLGIYESTQEFAMDWFGGGSLPRGVLRNTKREKLSNDDRRNAKEGFKESTAGGDIFVHGMEWEWIPSATTAATAGFLDQKTSSEKDVCRYIGVPAGMLDVEISTGNITYANATQANLQFLVTQLGPAVVRLQDFWSDNALPNPWKLRLNTDALLRMDPRTKAELMALLNANQLRTKTELRALDNLAPYEADQIAEIATFAQMIKPAPAGPVQKQEALPWLVPS